MCQVQGLKRFRLSCLRRNGGAHAPLPISFTVGPPVSGHGAAKIAIQARDLFTESRERVRATPQRGDFTDPRIGASKVDARTRESGREQEDAPSVSGSMFPRPHQ